MNNTDKESISLHRRLGGKIAIQPKIRNLRQRDIGLIYTPGVAAVSKRIRSHPSEKYSLTSKSNNIAIVTDGTRVLGLGNVGPYAALPVMEGKAVLYKRYGNVDAYPICLNATKKEEIINTIVSIEPAFGAINLEDIESPKALEISDELERMLPIPVFHDDRHGTAVAVLAALVNSLKVVKKEMESAGIVVAGAGSAGYGISELLSFAGCKNVIVTDSAGAIYKNRRKNMNAYKRRIAAMTNRKMRKGVLAKVLEGADVFIGVSGVSGMLSPSMVRSMGRDPVIFALTNPEPEIKVNAALDAGAAIVATGSYRHKNKVNNAVVFPYLMRVILDKRIKRITPKILYHTAMAVADSVPKESLGPQRIVPEIGNKRIQRNIRAALRNVR